MTETLGENRRHILKESRQDHLNASSEVERRDVSDVADDEGHRLAALEEGQRVVQPDGARVHDRKLVVPDQKSLVL